MTKKKTNIIVLALFVLIPIISDMNLITSTMGLHLIVQFLAFVYLFLNTKDNSSLANREIISTNKYFFILILICFLSTIDSNLRVMSMKRLLITGFNLASILYFCNTIIKNNEDFSYLLKIVSSVFITIGFYASVYQIVLSLYGTNVTVDNNIVASVIKLPGVLLSQVIIGRRPSSIFMNPNTYGLLLFLSQSFVIWRIYTKSIKKTFGIALFFIQLLGMTSSQSRSPLVALLIFITLLGISANIEIIKNIPKKRKIKYLVIIVIVFLSFSYLIIKMRSGMSGRGEIWKIGFNSIFNKPLLGVGFGVSSEILLPDLGMSLHNSFIKIGAEVGLLGAITVIVWLFEASWTKWKEKFSDSKSIEIFIITLTFALFAQQNFEGMLLSYNYITNLFFMFLILLSLEIHSEVPSTLN